MVWLGRRPWAGLVGRGSVVTPTARTTRRTALGKGSVSLDCHDVCSLLSREVVCDNVCLS